MTFSPCCRRRRYAAATIYAAAYFDDAIFADRCCRQPRRYGRYAIYRLRRSMPPFRCRHYAACRRHAYLMPPRMLIAALIDFVDTRDAFADTLLIAPLMFTPIWRMLRGHMPRVMPMPMFAAMAICYGASLPDDTVCLFTLIIFHAMPVAIRAFSLPPSIPSLPRC